MSSKKDSPSIAQERQACLQLTASASNSMQENEGTAKSGIVNVFFQTTKSRKIYYGVLCERSLELHESEKSQRKKKSAKYVIDISNCFNVAQQTFPKHKLCMSVMTPDETILIRGENDRDTIEWYKLTLSAMIPARALYLGRPVCLNEFFECAWDVCVSNSPKLKKPVANPENSPNICLKKPELAKSQYRLCFYPHTIILCIRGIEPMPTSSLPKSGLPPFKTTDFVEFSRQYLSNYGHQEKYFFMRIGRSAPTGLCEVWIQCESEETAMDVHNKLTDIIDRETEKKRKGLIALGTLPNDVLFNRASLKSKHRGKPPQSVSSGCLEESQQIGYTNSSSPPCSPSTSNNYCGGGNTGNSLTTIIEKPGLGDSLERPQGKRHSLSSSLSQSVREKRLVLRDYKAKVDSLEEELYHERQVARNQVHRGNHSIDQAITADIDRCRWNSSIRARGSGSHSASNICGTANVSLTRGMSSGNCRNTQDDSSQLLGNRTRVVSDVFTSKNNFNTNSITPPLMELYEQRDSVVSSTAEEETEDSGGTLRFNCDNNSRTASSLNLPLAANQQQQQFLVEALVEYHHDIDHEGGAVIPGKTQNPADNSYILRRSSQDTLSNQFFTNSPNTEDSSSAADAGADDSSLSLSDLNTPASCTEDDCRRRVGNSVIRRRATDMCANDSENASTSSSISTGCQLTDCERESGRSVPSEDHLCDGEYTFMDKASCSSDNSGSASHLIVPLKSENQVSTPEEICSYASDSGDSCYSSMVNGQLNSRAFSFSSEMPRPTRFQSNFPSDAGHCQQHKNSNSIRDKHCYLPLNNSSAFSEDKLNSRHSVMGTPLLENGEMKDDYLENKRSDNSARGQHLLVLPDEEARRRTFSLGSTSWLTKPLRKLSFNNVNRLRNSPSKSGSSLANSVTGESEDSIKQSYGCLGSRQPSTCSFASSRHTRSDSIDSSHSTSFVHNNASVTPTVLSQRIFSGNHIRRRVAEKLPDSDHFIELDFAPNSTTILSNSSSTTSVGNFSCSGARKVNFKGKRATGASHNSIDGISPTFSNNSIKFAEDCRPRIKDKKLKPSEAFIRTINHSGSRSRRLGGVDQGEHHCSPDYGLEEVQCFISPLDTEKMMSLSSKDSRDTTSLHSIHSQKTDAGHFETIKEHVSGKSSKTSSKNSLNHRSKPIAKVAEDGDGEYVLMPSSKQKQELSPASTSLQ